MQFAELCLQCKFVSYANGYLKVYIQYFEANFVCHYNGTYSWKSRWGWAAPSCLWNNPGSLVAGLWIASVTDACVNFGSLVAYHSVWSQALLPRLVVQWILLPHRRAWWFTWTGITISLMQTLTPTVFFVFVLGALFENVFSPNSPKWRNKSEMFGSHRQSNVFSIILTHKFSETTKHNRFI